MKIEYGKCCSLLSLTELLCKTSGIKFYTLALILLFNINAIPVYSQNTINSISIVSDDNYPPYIFRNENGELQGVIIDQWRLWELKTGIKVNIKAMDWGKAYNYMLEGNADVIETIFKNEEREKIFEFTQPYAQLEIPIFFHNSLSGINDVKTLRGFTIAVKAGDACIRILRNNGITTFKEYNSYESIIKGAVNGETRVFCIDKPPAIYYMYKYNVESQFKQSFILYTGEFHRAVKKGNYKLLKIVEEGFKKFSKSDYEAIDKKWFGSTFTMPAYITYITYFLIFVLILVVASTFLNFILRKKVKEKTLMLQNAIWDLTKSEEKFRTIFNSVNEAIFIHDLETGRIIDVNKSMLNKYGCTYEEALILDVGTLSQGEPPFSQKDALEWIRKASVNGPQAFEWLARTKLGDLFWVDVNMSVGNINNVDVLIVVVRSIDDRKKAELQLTESLKEKETLLKEIYHRTKNNMQVISSILGLQTMNVEDEITKSILKEMQNRIYAMSLVHQKLYQSKNLSRVDLNDYIKDLIYILMDSYEILDERITVNMELEKINVLIDTAIPMGLIISELITNSIKYAFPNNNNGAILISLKRIDNNDIELIIRDNGVGITNAIDISQINSLGLKIVYELVKSQLKGKINMDTSNGVCYSIYFSDTLYYERV